MKEVPSFPREFELTHAILRGVAKGLVGIANTVRHPLDNFLYPMSELVYDATVIAFSHLNAQSFEEMKASVLPAQHEMRTMHQYLFGHQTCYRDSIARMQQRVQGLKDHWAKFCSADIPGKVEMLSELGTTIYAPGFVARGAIIASQKIDHAFSLVFPPRFENLGPHDFIAKPFDIKNYSLSDVRGLNGQNLLIYVITEDGKLYLSPRDIGFLREHIYRTEAVVKDYPRLFHPDLAKMQDVIAAGECNTWNGRIQWINNGSGHYKPSGRHLAALSEDAFFKAGFEEVVGKFSFLSVTKPLDVKFACGPETYLSALNLAATAGGNLRSAEVDTSQASSFNPFVASAAACEDPMGVSDTLRRLNPRIPHDEVVRQIRDFFSADRRRGERLFQSVAPGEVGSKLPEAMRQHLQQDLPRVVASAYTEICEKANPKPSVPDYCAHLVSEKVDEQSGPIVQSFVEQMAKELHDEKYGSLRESYNTHLFDRIRVVHDEQKKKEAQAAPQKPTQGPKAAASSSASAAASSSGTQPPQSLPKEDAPTPQMAWPTTMKEGVQDVQQGAMAAAILAQHAGNKRMAQGFSKIATGAMCCAPMATAISAGAAVTPGAGLLAFAGLVVASEGAGNLFGFDFSDDDSNDAFQGLSLQLAAMYALLFEVYQLQVKTLKVIVEEFKHLNEKVRHYFKKTFTLLEKMALANRESFSELKTYLRENADTILQELAQLRASLPEITKLMYEMSVRQVLDHLAVMEAVQGLYSEPDRRLVTRLRHLLETLKSTQSRLPTSELVTYSRKLASACLDEVCRENVTGAGLPITVVRRGQEAGAFARQHDVFVASVAQSSGKSKKDCYQHVAAYYIAALSRVVKELGCVSEFASPLSNPLLLQDRVLAMVELYRAYLSQESREKIPTESIHDLGQMAAPLVNLQTFCESIDTKKLFSLLMDRFVASLCEFRQTVQTEIEAYTQESVVRPALAARSAALLEEQEACRANLQTLVKPRKHETWDAFYHRFERQHFSDQRNYHKDGCGHTQVYSGPLWLAFGSYPMPVLDRSSRHTERRTVAVWREFVRDQIILVGCAEDLSARELKYGRRDFKRDWGRDPMRVEWMHYADGDLDSRLAELFDRWSGLVIKDNSPFYLDYPIEKWAEILSQGSRVNVEALKKSLRQDAGYASDKPTVELIKMLLQKLIAFDSSQLTAENADQFAKQEKTARGEIDAVLAEGEKDFPPWDLFNKENKGVELKKAIPRFALPEEGSGLTQRLLIKLEEILFDDSFCRANNLEILSNGSIENKMLLYLEQFGAVKVSAVYNISVLEENAFQRKVKFTLELRARDKPGVLTPIYSASYIYKVATFYSLDEVARIIWYGGELSEGYKLDLTCDHVTHSRPVVSLPVKVPPFDFMMRMADAVLSPPLRNVNGRLWKTFLEGKRRACNAHLASLLERPGHPLHAAMQQLETLAGLILTMTAWLKPGKYALVESLLSDAFKPAWLQTLKVHDLERFTLQVEQFIDRCREFEKQVPVELSGQVHDGYLQSVLEQVNRVYADAVRHNECVAATPVIPVPDSPRTYQLKEEISLLRQENAGLKTKVDELHAMMKQMFTFFQKEKSASGGNAEADIAAASPSVAGR